MIKKSILLLSLLMTTGLANIKAQHKKQFNNNTKKSIKMETVKTAIEKLLINYQDALNGSDVSKVLPLYTTDGVFMPQGGPSAIGQEQLKGAYEFVFKNLQLNIKFQIDETVLINENYAFARTISRGTQLIHATGVKGEEENRELFVLQRENGAWKIARYVFNKMK
ncbi:DUF4440 domain-containing protein [Pedobacter sp. KBW06]|uniref:YybH family protein n=1 Tax=Pedobacter sp. KBW06 TaxID=2153359 RepID=UPI000F59597C|nr:SgcJ/EcaC family oxidoreductase [Pedobacter sp. KBW06]RQO69503.1 DUF4440 domain-containing protein [Pedobacter sp. KBW06]